MGEQSECSVSKASEAPVGSVKARDWQMTVHETIMVMLSATSSRAHPPTMVYQCFWSITLVGQGVCREKVCRRGACGVGGIHEAAQGMRMSAQTTQQLHHPIMCSDRCLSVVAGSLRFSRFHLELGYNLVNPG